MKKKILFTFFASLTMLFSVETMNMCGVCAMNNEVKTPIKKHWQTGHLKNSDGKKAQAIKYEIEERDEKLDFRLHLNTEGATTGNETDAPERLEDGWSYFAVLIDSQHKGPIQNRYLTFLPKEDMYKRDVYKCTFDLPYYCDVVDIHVYKQKDTDPAFTIKEENFIGRTKVFPSQNADFIRKDSKKQLTLVNKNSNSYTTTGNYFLSRLSPNYYSIQVPLDVPNTIKKIAKIILPDGQGKDLTEDDLTVNGTFFQRIKEDATPLSGELDQKGYFNFYLPDGVTNFKMQVFDNEIGKDTDVLFEFDVNLTKE